MKSRPANIPVHAGVYIFRKNNTPLYIGKAGNLKKRLVSYWLRNASAKTQRLVREATSLSWQETDSEIEALILEARLIKQHLPKYNVLMRDDKNYFYVGITKEEFSRIFITHQPQTEKRNKYSEASITGIRNTKYLPRNTQYIGPFTSGSALKTTLKLLRRIFPYCTCAKPHARPCLNAQIGRCLGYCCDKRQTLNAERQKEYKNCIRNIIAILTGKKQKLLAELKKAMQEASQKQEYERAVTLRNQITGLEDVFAHKKVLELPRTPSNWRALQKKLGILLKTARPIERIEGYDISNISGTDATGSMVVFTEGKPNKKEYRVFKIKTVHGANDPAMIGEVIARRLRHSEWRYPDIIVTDGGKTQLAAAKTAVRIREIRGSFVPICVTALAKREEELYTENKRMPIPLKTLDRDILHLFQAIRDEAHRFAKKYHHKLREMKIKKG